MKLPLPSSGHHPCAEAGAFTDPEHFAVLVSPHVPALLRQARALLGSDDLAWDAIQETLLRLWTRGWLGDEPRAVLHHLVRRSCLHLLRCQRRRFDHESCAGRTDACCEDDPLQSVASAELRTRLSLALAELAVEFREVFERHELRGHSYERIAQELGIPIGTVRSRLNRARSRLRDALLRGESC